MSPELTPQEFTEFWTLLNEEFPPYKVTAEDLTKQGRRYYAELRMQTKAALDDSFRAWARAQERRPKLAHLLAGCAAYHQRLNAALDIRRRREEPPRDVNVCVCGCGGTRWAMALLDEAGSPRRFPADPAAIGIPTLGAAAQNAIAGRVAALAGEFMTRDRVECLQSRSELVPRDTGTFLGRDDRGVPVWTIARPIQAAA